MHSDKIKNNDKMADCGLVDLSNPQWLSRNIMYYIINEVYHEHENTPKINWQMQYHFFMVSLCNTIIKYDLENESIPDYLKKENSYSSFKMTDLKGKSTPEEFNEIIRSCGDNITFDFCAYYSYIDIYSTLHNLTEVNAVRSILKYKGILFAPWYEDFKTNIKAKKEKPYKNSQNVLKLYKGSYIGNYSYINNNAKDSKEYILDEIIYFDPPGFQSQQILHAESLMKREDACVFLTDSLELAFKLQEKYGQKYGKYMVNRDSNKWDKYYQEMLKEIPPMKQIAENAIVANYSGVRDPNHPLRNIISGFSDLSLESKYVTQINSNIIWSSWFGGFDLLSYTDWTPIFDKKVFLVQIGVKKDTAIKHFIQFSGNLFLQKCDYELDKVQLVILEDKTDVINIENNPFKMYSYLEALEIGGENNIELNEIQQQHLAQHLRNKGIIKRGNSEYLIEPMIRKNAISIISGISGAGKSWFAMILAAALASKGKLVYDLKVLKKANVIYIADDEMSRTLIDEREQILKKVYGNYTENLIFDVVESVNLLNEDERNALEIKIDKLSLRNSYNSKNVKHTVLFLDHLNKLTGDYELSKQNWSVVRDWLAKLNKKKITVILVHHEYQHTKMSGSIRIGEDVQTQISIEKNKDSNSVKNAINLKFNICKNKGGIEHHEYRSFTLDANAKRLTIPEENYKKTIIWKSLTFEKKKELYLKLKDEGKKRVEIADEFGVSESTISEFVRTNGLSQKK